MVTDDLPQERALGREVRAFQERQRTELRLAIPLCGGVITLTAILLWLSLI